MKQQLTTILPIYVYLSRINNGLVFKIKDGYKLELQTPEKIKLFGSTKKINRQNKKRSLELVEVVLVQCSLVNNQYQQRSEVLYTFIPNKSYGFC